MAIIPDVPHVSVDIVVDGRPLPEYLDEDDEDSISPTSTIKYVECVSGSRFGIRTDLTGFRLGNLEGANAIEILYYLDGRYVAGAVHRFPTNSVVFTRHAARYRDGHIWKERDFMFADLVTCTLIFICPFISLLIYFPAEDGPSSKPRPELKDLGTITVKIYPVRAGKPKIHSHHRSSRPKMMVAHENIHEKHLKGQAISTQAK